MWFQFRFANSKPEDAGAVSDRRSETKTNCETSKPLKSLMGFEFRFDSQKSQRGRKF